MDLSSHALARCVQRRISLADIDVVMGYGTDIHNGGALFSFLRRKDIPGDIGPETQSRLEGLTVVMDPSGENVITVYRNRRGLRDVKRKLKRANRHCVECRWPAPG